VVDARGAAQGAGAPAAAAEPRRTPRPWPSFGRHRALRQRSAP
jgi:hypothetical protein